MSTCIHDAECITKKGSELTPEQQKQVLGQYVFRFTRNHIPQWVREPLQGKIPPKWDPATCIPGTYYPVHFDSDRDWLENTEFAVTTDGRLDKRVKECYSRPTWPDHPELRR